MEFRLGNHEVFWKGYLDLPCPSCRLTNRKTSDHSSEICTSCKKFFNWRFIAYRMYHEQVGEGIKPAEVSSSNQESRLWTPGEDFKRAKPRARALNGKYVKTGDADAAT